MLEPLLCETVPSSSNNPRYRCPPRNWNAAFHDTGSIRSQRYRAHARPSEPLIPTQRHTTTPQPTSAPLPAQIQPRVHRRPRASVVGDIPVTYRGRSCLGAGPAPGMYRLPRQAPGPFQGTKTIAKKTKTIAKNCKVKPKQFQRKNNQNQTIPRRPKLIQKQPRNCQKQPRNGSPPKGNRACIGGPGPRSSGISRLRTGAARV